MWSVVLALLLASPAFSQDPAKDEGGGQVSEADVFRRLLLQKRVEQLAAVQQLMTLGAEKQLSMLTTMMGKMKGVLQRSRMQLEASGFAGVPATAFPDNDVTRTALAHVVENTCFLGDVLLRFPDFIQELFSADGEWDQLFKWCLSFVESSGLTDKRTDELLDLAAQEVGMREKRPDYRNPYRKERKKVKRFDDPPPKKKKERKKLPRGPRMNTRSEL